MNDGTEAAELQELNAYDIQRLKRTNDTLRKLLDEGTSGLGAFIGDNGAVYGVSRDAEGIECPRCGGYAERVDCTPEEIKEHGCGRKRECCSRAFVCAHCNKRTAGSARAPEMEYF